FQPEDGIRDFHVTGVQTCALPISESDGPNRRADGVDAATYLLTPVTEPDGEAKPAEPKPLTRKRPAKPTAAQTTVMQRLWRNEQSGRASCREGRGVSVAVGVPGGR